MGCRYAGIDWATEKHDLRVADEDGSEVLAGTFVHDEQRKALARVSEPALAPGVVLPMHARSSER